MTDFIPQKTNQLSGTTDPYHVAILEWDSVAMSLTPAGSWYSGSASVEFVEFSNLYSNLEVDAWIRTQHAGGGNIVTYYKLPVCITDSSGAVIVSGGVSITQPIKSGVYTLTFNFGISGATFNPTVYYKLRTDRISQAGLSFV